MHPAQWQGAVPCLGFSLRVAIVACVTVAVCACAPLPVAPDLTRDEAVAKSTGPSDTSVNLEIAKKVLNGWHNEYASAAGARRKWELGFGEVLFYGSVFAVLGAVTNHDHVRNLGIAAAGGSSLLGGHYQVGAQKAAFRKAVRKLACIEEATMQITAQDERLFTDIPKAQKDVLIDLPSRIINRVRKVRIELGDTLNGIQLATPSREEIAGAFQKWLAARASVPAVSVTSTEAAAIGQAGLVDPATRQSELQMRKDRFLAALEKVNPEVEVCMADAGG